MDFSEREFRDAMGQFCTGVTVITGMCDDGPAGFAVQSFVSVSLDPPLVAFCPALSGVSWPRIRPLEYFGINILGAHQGWVCEGFAAPNLDRFDQVAWSSSDNGTPVLHDTLGFIECQLEAEHEAGDHTLVLARVIDFRVHEQSRDPLLFFGGSYGSFKKD